MNELEVALARIVFGTTELQSAFGWRSGALAGMFM